jgi:branched-chain amino acid aminotransferase
MFTWAYINDEFVPEQKAGISVRDLSILRGYGVFDYFRFENFQPVFPDEHLIRLFSSMNNMGLMIEPGKDHLKKLVNELIKRNALPVGGIRITVTGGYSENGYLPGKSTLIITQHSYDKINSNQFDKGIALASFQYQRQLPHIKTTDYIMAIYLQPWLKSHKSDDILYCENEIITECPRSNIFIFNSAGQLCTPADKVLHGITRNKVIQLAGEYYPVIEKSISLAELYEAREVFITSTTKQILPVRSINGRPIGKGEFPVSSHILQLYQAKSSIPYIA